MYYYVSMVIVLCMWLYVYCSGVEERHLPSTGVETINQSINHSIAINPVGDCSERTVLGFRSSLLVIIMLNKNNLAVKKVRGQSEAAMAISDQNL